MFSRVSPNWEICEVPFDDLSCVLQKEKKPELENSNCNNVEEICSSCHWCNTAETAKYIIAVQYIYVCVCVYVCVCFVCWLELDSSIALCNLSSLYTIPPAQNTVDFFRRSSHSTKLSCPIIGQLNFEFGKSDHKIWSFN